MQSVDQATFECSGCGGEFEDELPALFHIEAGPCVAARTPIYLKGESPR